MDASPGAPGPAREPDTAVLSRSFLLLLFVAVGLLILPANAVAWDSATHRLIVRLAIDALPQSPLKKELLRNQALVERHSVEPDSVLKEKNGKQEEIRHYLDIEIYQSNGGDALSTLDPDLAAMRKRVGEHTLERSGTLPWTIEDVAERLGDAWRRGDCSNVLREAGYLAHYVGDASQPLHSTIHYDGYEHDHGVHARVEGAVDDRASSLQAAAEPMVKVKSVSSVWPVAIDEIRTAHSLVNETIEADRKARSVARKGPRYTTLLFARAGPMLTGQIAAAASVLASIWLYEWKSAGSPSRCAN